MLGNIGFAADKIIIGKVDKVGIEQDNFCLFLCLFGAFRINGNSLLLMSGKGYIILFQCSFLAFSIKF